MSYAHTTLAQLKTALAARLSDTGNVYWTNVVDAGTIASELGLYIVEALRTWGLMTGYWRDSGTLGATQSVTSYDLSTLQNVSSESLLSYSTTDKDLSTIIQYHLLEPATGSSWTGSEQYILADITGALQRRRDALLLETAAVVSTAHYVQPPAVGVLDVADTTLSVRRMTWTANSGTAWPLYPEDISNQRNYSASYLTTPDIPQTYSSSSAKPLRYVIAPPPNEVGTIELLAVTSGAALDASGISLGIPDDMSWVVKWGALADILGKEGPGQDLARAYFCERRWKLGLALSGVYPIVINAEINGVSLPLESVLNLDQYSPNWMSTQGIPTFIASIGNFMFVSPAPNGAFSILLDVVRKAVLPTADGSYIQVGREYLDVILDYAEHLAAFKSGGMEFRQTFRAAENFFNAALAYNQRLAAQHPNIVELIKQSALDDAVFPLKKKASDSPLEQVTQISEQGAQLKSLMQ